MTIDPNAPVLLRIRKILSDGLAPGWDAIVAEWAQVGDSTYPQDFMVLGVPSLDGSRVPDEVSELFGQLRGMLAEDSGIWPLSITLFMREEYTDAGIDANYSHQVIVLDEGQSFSRPIPASDIRPTAEDWRRELELHPRRDEDIPEWWRQILVEGMSDFVPSLPSWMGRSMPQSIEDAREMPSDLLGPMHWMLDSPGFRDLFDPLRHRIFDLAEKLSADERDALFGRKGIAAQSNLHARLAREAVAGIGHEIDRIPEEDGLDMVYLWEGRMKLPHTDSRGQILREEIREAAVFQARQVITSRFGELPSHWHVK